VRGFPDPEECPVFAKTIVRSVAALSLVTTMIIAPQAAGATAATSAPVVKTLQGAIRGVSADGVDSFLGVRYAAAPVGALRWHPPQPVPAWRGVKAATAYGNRCPALASTNGPRATNEDCLFVNVQRPTGTRVTMRLPVYVFIHGGGLVNGSSNQADASKFVRETNAIVVTLNYRLGIFGFLGLPSLEKVPGDGNFGLLDQQAALRWVQRNIIAFGGNPSRVTVGGESAGGWSVCAHLVSPLSRGLFSQAMIQSGSCFSRPLRETEAISKAYAAAVGCAEAGKLLACLRNKPIRTLLDKSPTFTPSLSSGTTVLPTSTQSAVEQGRFTHVPLVVGSNRDEGRTFSQGAIGQKKADYLKFLETAFGAKASTVLAHYPWPSKSDRFTVAYLEGAIITDAGLAARIGGCTQLALTNTFARYTTVYAYEFAARNGPGLTPIPGYVWGAGHAAELAYLSPAFNNGTPIAPTFNKGERQLSRNLIRYWGAFVFNGRPNALGQARWFSYNATHRIMSLRVAGQSTLISESAYSTEHKCGFWNSMA